MPATVCTPLRTEQAALLGALSQPVLRTGRGPDRHRTSPVDGPLLVAGVAGALADGLLPGDVVVATELRTAMSRQPSQAAPLLAGALSRLGLRMHTGPVLSTDHVVSGEERIRLAASGALAVDTESAFLADAAPAGQTIAIRAIVDTPRSPLLRPGTLWRGLAALRTLRRSAPAIDQWAAATGDRDIVLAGPRSFCAGVERAIDIVERALELHGGPVYVRRQIVHNVHVIGDLEQRGAVFVEEVDEIPAGSVTVLAAHGVAPSVRRAAEERQLHVIDATCPLVTKVHNEVRRFAARDNTIFLIGHHDHEEVIGTRGEAADNVIVVADVAEAEMVTVPDPQKVSYVMQTTLSVDEAEETAAVLRERFPELAAPRKDDICYATTNRQQAVRAVARQSDLVIVIGSQNSSNSQRLAEVAAAEGAEAHLVDDASAVDLRWLDGAHRVGVTAGASAPSQLVDELVRCLAGLGHVRVSETKVVDEDVRFTLPREVS